MRSVLSAKAVGLSLLFGCKHSKGSSRCELFRTTMGKPIYTNLSLS